MAARHEEKYIIDYRQYGLLLNRVRALMEPDPHSENGAYVITSLYYDDPKDTALYEKLDGLAEHSKFRVRTYNCSDRVIRLERKDKHGIITHKESAPLSKKELAALDGTNTDLTQFDKAYDLVAQMKTKNQKGTVVVRYKRDAYYHPGTDLRVTFDTDLEALGPDPAALFSANIRGVPVLTKNDVILEIKYGTHPPAFVRTLLNATCKQLSVSKYALCRERFM